MSASIPISLRPLPAKDDHPLFETIGRINTEFPGRKFQDITEDFLLDQIARQQRAAADADADDDDAASDTAAAEPETHEDRRRQLYAARNEIQRYLVHANNEVAMLKDFMSLLLTHSAKTHAESTMSPELKQFMAGSLGTLAFDVHPKAAPAPAPDPRADDTTALGWKLHSLGAVADKLLHAAHRLHAEMATETRYWDQVLRVQEAGWPITRTRERGVLGVRYGLPESGPQFKSQGFASMRPDRDGSVKLDQGLRRVPRCVRVQVRRGARVLSSSVVAAAQDDDAPLESVIRQARDTLFEEELFFELAREAPSLLGADVRLLDHAVVAPLAASTATTTPDDDDNDGEPRAPDTVHIELVPLHPAGFTTGDPSSLAAVLALALRILMAAVYRARFDARSAPPAPLSKTRPPARAQHQLLRPLLNIHAQLTTAAAVRTLLAPIAASLARARLPATLAVQPPHLAAPSPGALVAHLSHALETRFTLRLTQQTLHVSVATEDAPIVGVRLTVVHAALDDTTRSGPVPFADLASLRTYLVQATRIDLLEHLAACAPRWSLLAAAGVLRCVGDAPGKQKAATVLIGPKGALGLAWHGESQVYTIAGKWRPDGGEGAMDLDDDGLVDVFLRVVDQAE